MDILSFVVPKDYFFYLNNDKNGIIFVSKEDEYYNTIAFTDKTFDYYVTELSNNYNTEIPDFYIWSKLNDKNIIKKFYSEYINFIFDSFKDPTMLETTTFATPIVLDTQSLVDKHMNFVNKNFKYELNKNGFVDFERKSIFSKYLEIIFVGVLFFFLLLGGIILPLASKRLPSLFSSKKSVNNKENNNNNNNNNNSSSNNKNNSNNSNLNNNNNNNNNSNNNNSSSNNNNNNNSNLNNNGNNRKINNK